MTENETPADRLREAAGKVRENWGRRQLCSPNGARCAAGAITRAVPGDHYIAMALLGDPIASRAATALHEQLIASGVVGGYWVRPSFRVDAITKWNDFTAHDAEEVATAMEKAAARYEEGVR